VTRSRIHYDAGDERDLALARGTPADECDLLAGSHRTLCGRPNVRAEIVTTDVPRLTCKACRRLAAAGLAKALARPPEPFTPRPVVEYDGGTSTLDEREERLAQGATDEPKRPPFRDLDHALRSWFRTRLASKIRVAPVIEGERSDERQIDPGNDDRARMPNSDRGVIEAHASVHPVEHALDLAAAEGVRFAGGTDGTGAVHFNAEACRRIVVLYQDGRAPGEVAEAVSRALGDERGELVTTRQAGLAWREMRRRIGNLLDERGLLARAPESEQDQPEREGAKMAHLPGYSLEGLKAIAGYLGIGQATVKRLIARSSKDNPLPVVKYLGGVYASQTDLDAWRSREAKRTAAA
jgi:hypothetical protein